MRVSPIRIHPKRLMFIVWEALGMLKGVPGRWKDGGAKQLVRCPDSAPPPSQVSLLSDVLYI
jgi:hypothetical protein